MNTQAASVPQASGSQLLSRRNIIKATVAVGVGGAALAEATPASAAGTTIEPGAVAPAVVTLADAGTIAVDASTGNDFRVTIAASRTMGNPANPTDGQQIIFQVTQGGSGSSTLTWSNAYLFSAGLPKPALSTAVGHTDLFGFVYNAAAGSWLLAAFVNGFA